MNSQYRVSIRKFQFDDIPLKVKWINDPVNHKYLHYDLPLKIEKTKEWFKRNSTDETRFDAVIFADDIPVGLIGLLSIDQKNRKAEYYISMGEHNYKGQGIAYCASNLLLEYAFSTLNLERIYLYTETENIAAQHLFKKIGFTQEGKLRKDLFSKNSFIDRFVFGILKEDYFDMKNVISNSGGVIDTIRIQYFPHKALIKTA